MRDNFNKICSLSEFEGGRLNCLVVPANLGEVEEVALDALNEVLEWRLEFYFRFFYS